MGVTNYDTPSAKQVNTNAAEFVLKTGGKVVGTTSRTVSKDGKSLVATAKDTTAKGER